MKKIHTIYLLLFGFLSQAQNVIIPDANFKSALVNTICTDTNGSGQPDDDVDTNNDGEIQISEAKAVTHLFVGGQVITSLMGIEEFTNLEFLICDNNGISTLSFLQNPNLNSLSCGGNNLIDLDITQNPNLELLYSFTNPLVNLDISQNTNLTHLIIPNNEIISLDLSQNENLIFFDAENNQLINLDISQNPNLLRLNVKNNQLINLNVNIGSNENLSVMIALDNPNLMCINVFDEDEANSNGCFSGGTQGWCKDASASYSENCTLGLAEINTSENITLFPNPTQNFINIKSDNPIINLKVYSMEGILLIDKNSTRINISELSSGVYFVNVSVNGRIISKKLIKS